jgi:hypothetical protein
VKKTIQKQKGRAKKQQAEAPATASAGQGEAGGAALSRPWVPGDEVMYVYADGAKERSPCLESCLGLLPA